VPFIRTGYDVGAFSTANIVLQRRPFDVTQVFGAGSTQAGESSSALFNDSIDWPLLALCAALPVLRSTTYGRGGFAAG
jgi:hypothetical protein